MEKTRNLKGYRAVALILILNIIILGLPLSSIYAQESLPMEIKNVKYYTDSGESPAIDKKGVEYVIKYIEMEIESGYKLANDGDLEKITIKGNEEDETDKFNITMSGENKIKFELKSYVPGEDIRHTLRDHTLYKIHIPKGTFLAKDGSPIANTYYNFVTKKDSDDSIESILRNDILLQTNPKNNEESIKRETEKIEFEFIGDVDFTEGVVDDKGNYKIDSKKITLSTESLDDRIASYDLTEAGEVDYDLSYFKVYIENNKLILEPKAIEGQKDKTQRLKDFAKYTIKLESGTVYLTDSQDNKIYNGATTLVFNTNNTVETTLPINGGKNIELEPIIKIKFKEPMEKRIDNLNGSIDITNISKGEEYTKFNASLEAGGRELHIETNYNSKEESKPLETNTNYRVTIPKGILKIKDTSITNQKIITAFTTTDDTNGPIATQYTSTYKGNDDIRDINKTKLGIDESIYIKFSTDIRADAKSGYNDIKKAIHLYKVPKADESGFDSDNYVYDKKFTYTYHLDDKEYKPIETKEEIFIKEVKLKEDNKTLEIVPRDKLNHLQQYLIKIENDAVEDGYSNNLEKDLIVPIWTEGYSDNTTPKWNIKNQEDTTSQTKVIDNEAPVYGLENDTPIVLKVIGEVIPNPYNRSLKVEENSSLYENAIENIKLHEFYAAPTKNRVELKIAKYEIEYDKNRNTTIYLYPAYTDPDDSTKYGDRQLHNGKKYTLEIPKGTFKTRGEKDLKTLKMEFITEQGGSKKKIYYLENNYIDSEDILMNKEIKFYIRGYNFHKNYSHIELIPDGGDISISIPKEDIAYNDPTSLTVTLNLNEDGKMKLEPRTKTSKYKVITNFDDTINGLDSVIDAVYSDPNNEDLYLNINPIGKPEIDIKYPAGDEDEWFNEKNLMKIGNTYFLKVVFYDYGNKLTLTDISKLREIRVYASGSKKNMVDTGFITEIENMEDAEKRQKRIAEDIFVKKEGSGEAILYIPINPLRSQTTYDVILAADIIQYKDISGTGNDRIEWAFTTTANPVVKEVIVATVPEDYDEDEPIYISGDFFGDDITVYFNSERADRVYRDTRTVRIDGEEVEETFLKIYLPEGNDRLEEGVYDIYVENDSDHETIKYGSLSVVKSGDYIPNEEYRVKNDSKKGEVKGKIKISEDIIELDSKYSDEQFLELDFDELMGQDVLIKKIKYKGEKGDFIDILETKSMAANISLHRVTLDNDEDEENITINLGQVEPTIKQILKKKLAGKRIKSDFIQVSGENYILENMTLEIPYKNSNGKGLEVLRYDEATRSFYKVESTVNLIDKVISVKSDKKGIFIAVE